MSACVFCDIIEGRAEADIVWRGMDAIVLTPLNPVTDGHVLVVPKQHVRYIWELAPTYFEPTLAMVANMARGLACNIIQSNGVAATQTVPHVHFHVVPRKGGDGLALPWTGQTDRRVGATPKGPAA